MAQHAPFVAQLPEDVRRVVVRDALTRYELQQVLLELWRTERITALMVTYPSTHGVFEDAEFTSPDLRAHLGEVVAAWRVKREVDLGDPAYPHDQ